MAAAVLAGGMTATAVFARAAMSASVAPTQATSAGNAFLGEGGGLGDVDRRGPALAPTAAALTEAGALGPDVQVAWTQFGTPRTITATTGWVATGVSGSAVTAARSWLRAHAGLFRMAPADVDALEVLNDAQLGDSAGHAVLFRQHFGTLPAANDGLIAVGVRDGNIASVTSSAAGSGTVDAAAPVVTAAQAVVAAAHDDGRTGVTLADVGGAQARSGGFTALAVNGFAQGALTRLVALPTPTRGVRLAYETDLQDVADGKALATVSFVDAVTGDVLLRHDAVDTLAAGAGAPTAFALDQVAPSAPGGGAFTGTFSPTACSTPVQLAVPTGTHTLAVEVAEVNSANDIALSVYRNGTSIGSSDEATSPEAVVASLPSPSAATDIFTAVVCASPNPAAPFVAPYDFVGSFQTSDQAQPSPFPYPAKWQYFENSPVPGSSKDVRTIGCWTMDPTDPSVNKDVSDCQHSLANVYARMPFDVDPHTGLPTFTTVGNAAMTAQAWGSPLTPAEQYRPVSPTRDYTFPWTDQWRQSKCDPASFASAQHVDSDAAIANLNVGHNRIHDWSYRLGFSERNYNLQTSNFGNTSPQYEHDAEVGNVQAGALTFGPANPAGSLGVVTGRDNANQITLQDGVPPITNQYLFQPIVGFFSACSDGDMDASVYLHEYTHAISNRMIAGPDTGLSGAQGGAMGESWSDLDAIEFLNEFGLAGKNGEDRYAEGAYVTGDNYRGIRDYNLLDNPLNYSDVGFDSTGPEVHADGEVWNASMMHVRQALIEKYDALGFKASDSALQLACATGQAANGTPASGFDGCPGNRRWIQYMYDSFLLEANGAPTMVDMKNMMLAADMLRTGGVDHDVMAIAFAQKGLGANASSPSSDDTDPTPDFAAPVKGANADVTFKLVDSTTGAPVAGEVYVGRYQARVTPVATTEGGTNRSATASFATGTYEFTVRADGYGAGRFLATFKAGQSAKQTVKLTRNVASAKNGATVSAPDARNAGGLIDDNEATDAGYDGSSSSTPIAGRSFDIALAGGRQTIDRVNVSAEHHPADPNDSSDFQGRLLGVRAFDIYVSSDGGQTYHKVYASPDDAFPSHAPRPVVPDLTLREFKLGSPVVADHVRIVVRSNQCTGGPDFRGDRDNDPTNSSDCPSTSNAYKVTIAEVQVFGGRSTVSAGNGT